MPYLVHTICLHSKLSAKAFLSVSNTGMGRHFLHMVMSNGCLVRAKQENVVQSTMEMEQYFQGSSSTSRAGW